MVTDQKLEIYLTHLNKALGQISVSEKAEIISEIKSHILDTQDNNPDQSLATILKSFGEPEAVATRYLTERGLKPVAPAKRQVVKWLTLGFVSTLALVLIFILALVWKFTPFVSVSKVDGREQVSLLGGTINVNSDGEGSGFIDFEKDENGKIKGFNFDFSVDGDDGKWVKRSKDVDVASFDELLVHFGNGSMDVRSHEDNRLSWKCSFKGLDVDEKDMFKESAGQVQLDFRAASKARCDILVPSSMRLKVKGQNGRVELIELMNVAQVDVGNGECVIEEKEGVDYRYDLGVVNGRVESFESSSREGAIDIKVRITNGRIKN